MRSIDEVFEAIKGSSFRRKFKLQKKELDYLKGRGLSTIMSHAEEFIRKRLAPADPPNDGKQTPWASHPVFVAQHATATCCRGCLQKWHNIPKGRELQQDEIEHILSTIERWLLKYN